MHRNNPPCRSAQSNKISSKGKYIANLILILAAAYRNFPEDGVRSNFAFLILMWSMLHLTHWVNFRKGGGIGEQIPSTSITSRVAHGDSKSIEYSWPSRYRRYRISRIRFNGHLVFKPEKKNCRRTNGRVDR